MFGDDICLERVRTLQLGGARCSIDIVLAKTISISSGTCKGVCDRWEEREGCIYHLLNNEAPRPSSQDTIILKLLCFIENLSYRVSKREGTKTLEGGN